MYTVFGFLVKTPKLSTTEFIEYYESHHVPLINRLAGPENQPLVYKRRYTHRDDAARVLARASVDADGRAFAAKASGSGADSAVPRPSLREGEDIEESRATSVDAGNIDFDVITEVGFADEAAMHAWMAAMGTGENGKIVAEDENRFLWRERTRAVVVEERVSFG